MIDQIYIEKAVLEHPRARAVMGRFPHATVTVCDRYGEIFNRKAQNFRLQKRKPALILAGKFANHVLPSPPEYAIGGAVNYYFSHMLNCIYDCRYCFLQGMYRSAHYVLFINYEDFCQAIIEKIQAAGAASAHFFSGYDCDSLALDPVTDFVREFLPVFRCHPQALLELRTRSTQIRALLAQEPMPNCVVAFSFTPAEIAAAIEHKAPPVPKRLQALQRLQEHGWPIGLRFDPLIYQDGARQQYERLFGQVFDVVEPARLHSVSLGSFRLPKSFYRNLTRLYPDEVLFASPLEETADGMVAYRDSIRRELLSFCRDTLLNYVAEEKFFPCEAVITSNADTDHGVGVPTN